MTERNASERGRAVQFVSGRSTKFGRYELFADLKLLLRDGNKIDLGGRAFDVLLVLAEAGGDVVSKELLIQKVWAGAAIEDNSLQAQISAIRRALGPDRDLLSTDFGRGYRLAGLSRTSEQHHEAERTLPATRLPFALTPLLGRERECFEVGQFIARTRCVTLTGPGGIGKTRLALEVGRSIAPTFSDGVHLVEMARVTEDSLVWSTIAGCLQVPNTDQPEQLLNDIKDKHLLLIVDNCEHLTDSIAVAVEALLRAVSKLHILVTAQEPLGAEGEHVYRLSPLSIPPPDTDSREEALSHAAVRLFVDRASAGSQSFNLTHDNFRDVCAICRRLDGLPLSLELASARVSALGLQGVIVGLDDRFKLLTAGRRTALPRQRTLRATVDWSHSLLNTEEQSFFHRLAVFASYFNFAAARHVAGPDFAEPWRISDLLADLVAKSLLLCEVDTFGPRYRLLETIRFYALEKLAESSEVAAVAQRHADFVAAMVETGAREWVTAPTEVWRREHQSEIDDLRAALDWAFSPEGAKPIGLKILANSAPYWIQLSMHDECQRWLTLALATSSSIPPEEELALRVALGTSLSWAKGPVKQTGSVWASACELAVRLNHVEAQLQSRYGLWLFFLRSGEYKQSLAHAAEMMKLAQAVDDAEALAAAQRIVGVSRHFLGDHSEARSLIEASLAWYDQGLCSQPFRFGLDQRVSGLAFLSRVLWVQGEFAKAFEAASASITGARALDHACTMCCALAEGWCTVNALAGDRDAVESGSLMLIKTGAKYGLGFWTAYGEIFQTWAEVTGAKQPGDALLRLISLHKDIDLDPGYSSLIGDLLVQHSSAASLAQIDMGFLGGRDDEINWATPEFARIRARLSASLDQSAAERLLNRALSLAAGSGAHAWELKIAVDLARLLINEARADQAREVLGSALSALPAATGALAEEARSLMAGCGPY